VSDVRLRVHWCVISAGRGADDIENPVTNFHTLIITTAHNKSFQSAFLSRFPVTDLNNRYSSIALNKCSLHRLPYSRVTSKSESESELLYDWRFTADQIILASGPLRPTKRDPFSKLNFAVIVLM
jgi:hypothetical protein